MKDAKLFPIEVDLSRSAFQYESVSQQFQVIKYRSFRRLIVNGLKVKASYIAAVGTTYFYLLGGQYLGYLRRTKLIEIFVCLARQCD